jgi:hypothetical protein
VAPPLTAAHGAEIAALAATSDGRAIASADRLGGIRLWTTLDGTHEPVVIRGTAPRAIALMRDGDGFAIGTLDAAGVVHLIRTRGNGAVHSRLSVAGEQPATEITSTAEGLLIVRADQTVELVDLGGTPRSRLTPEPGTHVDSLVTRGGQVLALIQEDKVMFGRWIEVDHGARWGKTTPRLPFKIAHAVLSPSGDRLAASRPRSLHPVLIDLATGAALKTPLCVTKGWPRENDDEADESALLRNNNAPFPLGFLTDKVVACSVMTALVWWNTEGTEQPSLAGSFAIGTMPTVTTDLAVVMGTGPSLSMLSPDVNRFLGYGMHNLASMHASAAGVLVDGADQQSILLDGGLRERARFEVTRGRADWLDALAIDDRYAIAVVGRRSLERRETGAQIAVFDGVARAVIQLLPYAARDKEVSYEPSTGWLSTSDGAMSVLVRFDPKTHTFGPPVMVGTGQSPTRAVLLDPRLSGGIAALVFDQVTDGVLVGELREAELRPGTTVQPRTTYRVPGELRAVDRAGHVYAHGPADHDDVVVFARGVAGARLPGVAALTLRPSPDGARIAAFQAPRLVLLSAAGEVRWDSAVWSGNDLDWTSSGELVMQFPSGIARIDLETGGFAERRCGWGFGLSDQLVDAGAVAASICDAER